MHNFFNTCRTGVAQLAVTGTLLLVAGCSSTGCVNDPRYDNLGCAASNLSNGTYRAQTAAMRADAADQLEAAARARRAADAAEAKARTAQAASADIGSQVTTQQAELERLRRELATLQAQLAAARRSGSSPTEITALEDQVSDLQGQIDALLAN